MECYVNNCLSQRVYLAEEDEDKLILFALLVRVYWIIWLKFYSMHLFKDLIGKLVLMHTYASIIMRWYYDVHGLHCTMCRPGYI